MLLTPTVQNIWGSTGNGESLHAQVLSEIFTQFLTITPSFGNYNICNLNVIQLPLTLVIIQGKEGAITSFWQA